MKMNIMDKTVNPRLQYLVIAVYDCNVTYCHHTNGCKQYSEGHGPFLIYTGGFQMTEPLCKTIRGENDRDFQNVIERDSRQTISEIFAIFGLSTGTIHTILTDHINRD